MTEVATTPQTPTERYRQRLQGLLDQRAELQAHFDDIVSEGDDGRNALDELKAIDEDIASTRFTLEASERADRVKLDKAQAQLTVEARKVAERKWLAYQDECIAAERLLAQFAEQWERAEAAYHAAVATTPDLDAITMPGQQFKPHLIWGRLFMGLRQRVQHEIPRPMSLRPLESLSDLFGRKRSSAFRWLGM